MKCLLPLSKAIKISAHGKLPASKAIKISAHGNASDAADKFKTKVINADLGDRLRDQSS